MASSREVWQKHNTTWCLCRRGGLSLAKEAQKKDPACRGAGPVTIGFASRLRLGAVGPAIITPPEPASGLRDGIPCGKVRSPVFAFGRKPVLIRRASPGARKAVAFEAIGVSDQTAGIKAPSRCEHLENAHGMVPTSLRPRRDEIGRGAWREPITT